LAKVLWAAEISNRQTTWVIGLMEYANIVVVVGFIVGVVLRLY
jgi:hypothetical protein